MQLGRLYAGLFPERKSRVSVEKAERLIKEEQVSRVEKPSTVANVVMERLEMTLSVRV